MTNNKKSVLFASIAIVLLTSGSVLLIQTLNVFYPELSAWIVICSLMLSVFLYVAGTTCAGRSVNEIQKSRSSSSNADNSIIFAFLLIAVGLLLLGFNTGYFPLLWKNFFFSWSMLFVLIGAINLFRNHFILGIIIISAGIFFLLPKAKTIYPDIINKQLASSYWLPICIIIAGVLIILSIIFKSGRCKSQQKETCKKEPYSARDNQNKDGKINYRFTFGGTEQVILDPVFKGGNIDITFGGMELDLSRTSLPEGDTFLYVKATFGGIEITAPENWKIENHSDIFVGGFDDSRSKEIEKEKNRKLIIVSKCRFGGIAIQ